MRVAAIDTDTKQIAWAVVELGGPESSTFMSGSIKAKGRRAEDRFPGLMKSFREFVPLWWRNDWVYLELPAYTRNAGATISQSVMLGGLSAVLLEAGLNFSYVNNTVWKKALLGAGNATKDQIRAWVKACYGDAPNSQDECDALAIAQWGLNNFLHTPLVGAGDTLPLDEAGS